MNIGNETNNSNLSSAIRKDYLVVRLYQLASNSDCIFLSFQSAFFRSLVYFPNFNLLFNLKIYKQLVSYCCINMTLCTVH